ncbi:hypothetical protein KLP40_07465 [Hymenobacter sp. NST-14]|uniref:hypothetical protein n=1 Tax=Hymenobacter piscis TaxID=2839984 RepID=UPI001C021B3E|nr:hypothetical protein [Hymenobacter piscis]MBT9392996.1 hypothetical protein [Hymenobacter piscis]
MPAYQLTRQNWGGLAVLLLSLGILLAVFGPALLHPGHYYFQAGGDGIQSYFATAYYAFYDGGQHFSGMNYPVGENFNYPNLQPLIAWGIATAQRLGLPAARHTIGITNAAALGSLLLTPPVMYLLLRRFRLPVVYAVIMALLIGFLSPQVQRLGDHMSLSYTCFVPALWYCIIRMQDEPYRAKWYVVFGVLSILMGLIMLYFLACGCMLLLLHAGLLVLRKHRPWGLVWRMSVAALVPLGLTRSWLWLTDTVTDRPPNPYGLLEYVATPTGVFSPSVGPGQGWWQTLFQTEAASYEAMAYVGLVTTLTLLVVGFLAFRKFLIRPTFGSRLLPAGIPDALYLGLVASGILLLISFGQPMKFPGLGWLVDYLGPFKQFRALGRFAWPFYYVATVFTAWLLWRLWQYQQQAGQTWLLRLWLPALLLVWAGEAWINLDTKARQVLAGAGAEDFFNKQNGLTARLSWANRRPEEFQAILPLPYFNKGSDRIDLDGSGESMFQAHRLAVTTGLPELSTYVSRPSMTQVLRHVQLLSSTLVPKPLLHSFPSRKPLLLLVTSPWLSPEETRLVSLSHLLIDAPEGRLYELTLDSLARTTIAREREQFHRRWPTLPARPDGLRATTAKGVLYQPFNDKPDRRGRLGAGAFHEPKSMFSILYDGPLPAPADTGRYEVSTWVNAQTAYGIGNMQVKQYVGEAMVDHQVVDGRLTREVLGEWVRLALPIRVQPGVSRLEVLYDSRDLLTDDLLIRPADTDVYWLTADKTPVLNGYPLTADRP